MNALDGKYSAGTQERREKVLDGDHRGKPEGGSVEFYRFALLAKDLNGSNKITKGFVLFMFIPALCDAIEVYGGQFTVPLKAVAKTLRPSRPLAC